MITVLCVDLGTGDQQDFGDLCMSFSSGPVQRGFTIDVLCINLGTGIQ